jgi:predicted nucleic acid-binding protein
VSKPVIDASVIVAAVTPEEQSKWAFEKISQYSYFHILDSNYYEVANALRYKRTDNSALDIQVAWEDAKNLMSLFILNGFSEAINDAFAEAKDLNITVYDAAHVILADKLKTNFLTVDMKLVKKLEKTKYSAILNVPQQEETQRRVVWKR